MSLSDQRQSMFFRGIKLNQIIRRVKEEYYSSTDFPSLNGYIPAQEDETIYNKSAMSIYRTITVTVPKEVEEVNNFPCQYCMTPFSHQSTGIPIGVTYIDDIRKMTTITRTCCLQCSKGLLKRYLAIGGYYRFLLANSFILLNQLYELSGYSGKIPDIPDPCFLITNGGCLGQSDFYSGKLLLIPVIVANDLVEEKITYQVFTA